jgi:hypothetical protein
METIEYGKLFYGYNYDSLREVCLIKENFGICCFLMLSKYSDLFVKHTSSRLICLIIEALFHLTSTKQTL